MLFLAQMAKKTSDQSVRLVRVCTKRTAREPRALKTPQVGQELRQLNGAEATTNRMRGNESLDK